MEKGLVKKYAVLVSLNTIYHLLKIVAPYWRINNYQEKDDLSLQEKVLRRCDYINIVFLSLLTAFVIYTLVQWSKTTYMHMRDGFNKYRCHIYSIAPTFFACIFANIIIEYSCLGQRDQT